MITGGGRGIGKAIARRLVEAGADLVVGDLNAQSAVDTAADMRRRVRGTIPLNRFGHPDDIARAVLSCASPLAAFVTASTVFADGGLSAIWSVIA